LSVQGKDKNGEQKAEINFFQPKAVWFCNLQSFTNRQKYKPGRAVAIPLKQFCI
jgi:hypothetical protein